MNTLLNRRTVLMTAALGAGTTLLQACGGGDDEPQRTIVEIAQNNPDLSILVEAVVAAGLTQTLSTGSLTVFAPTNAAFAALLTELGVTEALLASKTLLTAVLSYGCWEARWPAPTCPWARRSPAGRWLLQDRGHPVVSRSPTDATASTTSPPPTSGQQRSVHLLDRVLLPADKDIVATASVLPDFQHPGRSRG